MNPKNILNLLRKSFDHPQYDIESIVTTLTARYIAAILQQNCTARLQYYMQYCCNVAAIYLCPTLRNIAAMLSNIVAIL